MRLTLLRHAKAVEREDFAGGEAERPLTPLGIEQCRAFLAAMRPVVHGLCEATVVWTSPWLRARHTAELAAAAWELPLCEKPWLAGEQVAPARWPLASAAGAILVGHEPDLSRCIAHCCGFATGQGLALRKSGMAVLDGDPHPGGMELIALLPPKAVRRLGRRGGR